MTIVKRIIRWVGIILGLLILIFAGALLYKWIAGPVFVNESLTFENELAIPPLLEPIERDGTKIFELTLQAGETEFFAGTKTQTWGANGTYLMPTIRASDQDNVEVHITSELGEMTTIHWHGMHLPAIMDGVHQIISPEETWEPYWQVHQQAATLWYHPHLHGVTGPHVYNGLAGMFIIDDANSQSLEIPQEYGVNDFPLIVQDRRFDENNQFVYANYESDLYGHKGMHGDTLLINGTVAPYLEVPAGMVRLRILNGSNARRYNFGFEDGREFYQITSDGGFLEQPVARTRMLLSAAERAEILVDMSDLNDVTLMSYPVVDWPVYEALISRLIDAVRDEDQQFKVLELRPQDVADVADVAAEYSSVPERLNTIERFEEAEAVTTRRFVFGDWNTINGQKMQIDRIDEVVYLDTVEIWEIFNDTGAYHPFHVHDVQFQILDRDGKAPLAHEMGWKDTVHLGIHETVRIMVEFKDYADPHVPYMYHCHVLEHEDHGMMGQFVVVADDSVEPEVITEAAEMGMTHEHTEP